MVTGSDVRLSHFHETGGLEFQPKSFDGTDTPDWKVGIDLENVVVVGHVVSSWKEDTLR